VLEQQLVDTNRDGRRRMVTDFQSHGRRMSTDYGLSCDVAVRIPRSSYSTSLAS